MLIVFPLLILGLAAVASTSRLPARSIVLDQATVVGLGDGIVTKFLGIPYAYPPIGDRRLHRPEPLPGYNESFKALQYGPMCPNQYPTIKVTNGAGKLAEKLVGRLWSKWYGGKEDCLTINVIAPENVVPSSHLPVFVWIYGGAFTMGSTEQYTGENIVKRSIEIGSPIIYVSFNYRLAALGFLGGSQVKAEGIGNLGLQDQRLALLWVKKYISAFGGDPSSVTIGGESAGAISTGLHMLMNNGDPQGLFRGAWMQSGAPIPVGNIENGQPMYDSLVKMVGCGGDSDSLGCLRKVPFDTFYRAMNTIPGLYLPRVDGNILTDTPFSSIQRGLIARVPFVTGNLDDEGTAFAVPSISVETEDDFLKYLKERFFPLATPDELAQVAKLYPNDTTKGSPYGTGDKYVYTPQFKRIASIEGDAVFHTPRRFFLEYTWDKQPSYNYHSTQDKDSVLGSYHTSDLKRTFGEGAFEEYLIRFVSTLDPNGLPTSQDLSPWPRYTLPERKTLILQDAKPHLYIGDDTFRTTEIDNLKQLELKYPL
ncbi:hypothetical protein FRB99_007216 [Tulasnella sp. 403]|nr:hypothetical protein FRB99_007216 [Tulasnella sp. 403]